MKPAAIAAQLVDLRNVGTHKVVKLTVHVPEEHALKLTEAFGWPTMVNPVPVAIARLVEPKEGNEEVSEEPRSRPHGGGAKSYAQEASEARRHSWAELSPAQQCGIRCGEPAFWTYLSENYDEVVGNEDQAADLIRHVCGVQSRALLQRHMPSGKMWDQIDARYGTWLRAPAVVG